MTHIKKSERARELRKKNTDSESLLWNFLRARQLCGLKFRREHPIGSFFADFACVSQKLVIEIDGDYHDHVAESDISRESYLHSQGWKVIRFSDQQVLEDIEAIGITIQEVWILISITRVVQGNRVETEKPKHLTTTALNPPQQRRCRR